MSQPETPIVFLPLPDVIARTGLSRSTIYRLVDDGEFPQPVNLTARRIAFVESEIAEWQHDRLKERA